jgi:signal transduction histidine kinase
MHVFIDTTGIIKLEEAKSNIKLQKIMFASASHEFRTPLNAIMNSFKLIEDQFGSILEFLHKNHRVNLRNIDEYAERIK